VAPHTGADAADVCAVDDAECDVDSKRLSGRPLGPTEGSGLADEVGVGPSTSPVRLSVPDDEAAGAGEDRSASPSVGSASSKSMRLTCLAAFAAFCIAVESRATKLFTFVRRP
jgi:hypothetical protein